MPSKMNPDLSSLWEALEKQTKDNVYVTATLEDAENASGDEICDGRCGAAEVEDDGDDFDDDLIKQDLRRALELHERQGQPIDHCQDHVGAFGTCSTSTSKLHAPTNSCAELILATAGSNGAISTASSLTSYTASASENTSVFATATVPLSADTSQTSASTTRSDSQAADTAVPSPAAVSSSVDSTSSDGGLSTSAKIGMFRLILASLSGRQH